MPSGTRATCVSGLLGAAVVLGVSLCTLAVVAATFWRGLDFWDESYWLLLIDLPGASRPAGEVYLVQFLLHPLLDAVGRDIALFRMVGLAMLVLAAWAANSAAVAVLRREGVPVPRAWAVLSPVVVAACSTTAYVGAGRIPGYRVVVLVVLLLLVCAVARLWAHEAPPWAALVGACVVLSAAARPTSAVALAAVVAGVVVPATPSGLRARATAWGVLGALLATTAVLASARMTPSDLVDYLARGAGVEAASGAHSSWATMLGIGPVPLRVLLVLGPLLLLPLALAVHDVARNHRTRWAAGAQLGVGLAAAVGTAVLGVRLLSSQGFGDQVRQLVLLWGLLPLLALVLLWRRAPVRAPRRPVALVALLLLGPYVATVGTNTTFTATMAQAGVMWALAVVACVPLVVAAWPRATRVALPVGLFLVGTALVSQVVWFADSLEGRGVREGTASVALLGGTLAVEPDTAALLSDLATTSAAHDLTGRPAVDLTGYGAGYQLALGTRPLGRASFFGHFRGADRGAALALARESCAARASALVLHAEDNPLDVSAAIDSWGVDLDEDYEEVARFHPTHGTAALRGQTVQVLRPGPRVAEALGCPGNAADLSPSAGPGPGPAPPAAAAGPRR